MITTTNNLSLKEKKGECKLEQTSNIQTLKVEVTNLRAQGKYKETIEKAYELLNDGLAIQDHKAVLISYINSVAAYYCLGAIEEALENLEAYFTYCQLNGDEADWLNYHNTAFLLYEIRKDFGKSIETLHKTIELGEALGYLNIVSNAYSNLSHIYMEMQRYEEALANSKKAVTNAEKFEPYMPILIFRAQLNEAKNYIYLQQFEKADALIKSLNEIGELQKFPREYAQLLDLTAFYYRNVERYEEAYIYYEKAKQIVYTYKDFKLLKAIQTEICHLCDVLHDYEKGYAAQKEYIEILDELSKREIELAALKLDVKHDLTELKIKLNTDQLTGLYNRHYIEKTVNEWMNVSVATPISCFAIDLDNFKLVNDRYGHLIGDEAIKLLGQTCKPLLKESELMGRYGGDEFVIVLQNCTQEEALKRAKVIYDCIRKLELYVNEECLSLSASIGVADNVNKQIDNFAALFQLADEALYEAKHKGKNQIIIK